jgi:hypothetical protein
VEKLLQAGARTTAAGERVPLTKALGRLVPERALTPALFLAGAEEVFGVYDDLVMDMPR